MKKMLISLVVVALFIIYAVSMKHKAANISTASNANTSNTTSHTTATNSSNSGGTSSTSGPYKSGTYTGTVANAYWGGVQISATISAGKIVSIKILQYPNSHSASVMINQQALPYLQKEVIKAQSTNIQLISGATFTSQAFVQSLSAALNKAKA